MDCISQLPDCVLSYILTMLSMKDLLKTSVLSRRWCKLWALRRNLNFDIHNVLGSETELLETRYLIDVLENSTPVRYVDLDLSRGEFVKRVDQFVKNFQGTKIDSFLVDFYLNCKQSSSIDQWISFAIERGVGRIDLLLLGRPYARCRTSRKPYRNSVMVTYPKFFENQKDIKDVEIFSHDEVKVIELGGCVGNWYEIEFVINVLKCVHKPERMVLSPYWREHDSFDWNSDPVWFQKGRERIREKLQGEVVVGPAEVVLSV